MRKQKNEDNVYLAILISVEKRRFIYLVVKEVVQNKRNSELYFNHDNIKV